MVKNRLVKSPMLDALANGDGDPTEAQASLYERWAEGGTAIFFIGVVQGDPYPRLAIDGLTDDKCDPDFPKFKSTIQVA